MAPSLPIKRGDSSLRELVVREQGLGLKGKLAGQCPGTANFSCGRLNNCVITLQLWQACIRICHPQSPHSAEVLWQRPLGWWADRISHYPSIWNSKWVYHEISDERVAFTTLFLSSNSPILPRYTHFQVSIHESRCVRDFNYKLCLIFKTTMERRYYYHQFTQKEDIKTQRRAVTCPRS